MWLQANRLNCCIPRALRECTIVIDIANRDSPPPLHRRLPGIQYWNAHRPLFTLCAYQLVYTSTYKIRIHPNTIPRVLLLFHITIYILYIFELNLWIWCDAVIACVCVCVLGIFILRYLCWQPQRGMYLMGRWWRCQENSEHDDGAWWYIPGNILPGASGSGEKNDYRDETNNNIKGNSGSDSSYAILLAQISVWRANRLMIFCVLMSFWFKIVWVHYLLHACAK